MDNLDLKKLLENLIKNWENEIVEFKEANKGYSTDTIAKYFSALANEANLREEKFAYLVFGVNDKSRKITGTNYRVDKGSLHSLKNQMTDSIEPKGCTFRNIYEYFDDSKRVILCEIPAAPKGFPVSCKGQFFGRAGESITSLDLGKLDEIRNQTIKQDWTAQIVENATIKDLDQTALEKARELFTEKTKNKSLKSEISSWSDEIFLEKLRLSHNNKLTKAALLLLGKEESTGLLLTPNPVQITWKLEGEEKAYEHFTAPFLLSTTALYHNIRNINIRITPEGSLLPTEMKKYDQESILESLHNCIAHQDYLQNARVLVSEYKDKLIFENHGSFYEGIPEDYILNLKTPSEYRNPCLVNAMVQLNMIDSMGQGIGRIYKKQVERYFPLADYDLSENDRVSMVLYGAIINESYTQMLLHKKDLPKEYVVALDKIQKKLPIDNDILKKIRKSKLVEGGRTNLHISSAVAMITGQKADYIKMRKQNDQYYCKLITDYIEEFGSATRADLNQLLNNKLSEILTDKQKYTKIDKLLSKMKEKNIIYYHREKGSSKWLLKKC